MSDIFQQVADLTKRSVPCALCTVVRTGGSVPRHAGSKMLVGADGSLLAGTVGGGAMESRVVEQALQALADGKTRLVTYKLTDPIAGDAGVCGGEVEVFIEPYVGNTTLVVVGAGHVGKAVVHLGKWNGFRVIVVDDRPELCNASACPDADAYICAPIQQAIAQITVSSPTYVAMLTRGVPLDVEALPLLLQLPVAYIGVIGSRRRWLTAVDQLRAQGVTDQQLSRIHAPIGIEIGAETPEEIAVSVMAQIIGIQHGLAL
jgi:xanthine dehydrogenase accessory factor